MGTRRCGPKCRGITVQCGFGIAVGASVLGDQIFPVAFPNGRPEFFESLRVSLRQQPSLVGSQSQHQLAAVPDGVVIDGDQFTHRLGFIIGVPKPMLAQRRVCFHGPPAQIAGTVDDIPVFVENDAVFVTYPSDISILKQRHIREDQSIGLIDAKFVDDAWKVVNMPTAAGAVEPEFLKLP